MSNDSDKSDVTLIDVSTVSAYFNVANFISATLHTALCAFVASASKQRQLLTLYLHLQQSQLAYDVCRS